MKASKFAALAVIAAATLAACGDDDKATDGGT